MKYGFAGWKITTGRHENDTTAQGGGAGTKEESKPDAADSLGWFTPLPPDWEGERHVVVIRREPSCSPRVEWYEWEECISPTLIATDLHISPD